MKAKFQIMAACMMLSVGSAQAQNLNSAYYTDQYLYRHTMNPAISNEQGYVALPALGNLNISSQGNFGYGDVVFQNPRSGRSAKSLVTFMNPYISVEDALNGFSSGKNRIVANVGVTLLSAGFKGFGGYNTIELNAKSTVGLSIPYEMFEFAKNIGNKSYDIGNISASAMSYVELAFGHSHQVNSKLQIGAKMKLLFGAARADLKMENMKADLTALNQWLIQGSATADVSMKGFTYKEEYKEYKNEERGSYRRVNDVDVSGGGLGGFGLAFDLGAVYAINEDWKVNAAILDLGFIRWSNDLQARNINDSFIFNGFHDASVTSDRPGENGTIKEQGQNYGDQLADFANLQSQGDLGGRTTGIGATLNFGVEYNLPVYRPITFGLLSSTRIFGNHSWTDLRLSANWKPLKWLDGGVSLSRSSFCTSFGWVLNLHPRGFNFFLGMDHLLGKLSKEGIPLSSNASVTLGMNITW